MGVELVANPSVLMLDEPTSNLDSRTALAMVKVIRQVARTGRAVVCTIHQPSAEVFQHFDRLLLLQSGGFPVFFGDLANLESYMSSIPGVAPRSEDSNVATWMLDVIGAGTSLGREAKEANLALKLEPVSGRDDGLESPSVTSNLLMQQPERKLKSQEIELVEWKASKDPETEALHNHAKRKTDRFNSYYLSSSLFKENELRLDKACEKKQLSTDRSSYARSFWVQYLLVQYRCFVNYWRLIHFNTTRFWVCLFIAIFFGLVWFDIDDTTMTGVNSKMSGMFMGMVFSCTVSSTPQFHLFFLNRAMFHRELLSRAYSSWVYSLSNMIIELVYGAAATLMFSVIFYFLLGLQADAASFFMWVLGVYMLHMILDLLAQVHIAVLEGIATSHSVYDLFFTACFLLSGLTILLLVGVNMLSLSLDHIFIAPNSFFQCAIILQVSFALALTCLRDGNGSLTSTPCATCFRCSTSRSLTAKRDALSSKWSHTDALTRRRPVSTYLTFTVSTLAVTGGFLSATWS